MLFVCPRGWNMTVDVEGRRLISQFVILVRGVLRTLGVLMCYCRGQWEGKYMFFLHIQSVIQSCSTAARWGREHRCFFLMCCGSA